MRKIMIALSILILLAGCSTINSDKMLRLEIGMDKQDVLKIMGKPDTKAAKVGNIEYLIYRLTIDRSWTWRPIKDNFFVQFVDDMVVSFGEIGFFYNDVDPSKINKK